MTKKDSFVLYTSMLKSTKKLSLEQKGKLFEAILEYQETGEVPEIDDLAVEIYFDLIKNQMDIDNKKFEETLEKRREAGKRGGRPKKQNQMDNSEADDKVVEPEVVEEKAKKANGFEENQMDNKKTKSFFKKANGFSKKLNENENENVNENVNENEKAEYINNAAAKNFFERFYTKLSNYTKEIPKFKAEYDAVLMSLISKYSQESVVSTLKAALEDDFWLNKLFEPKSLERNFAKMKWELVDKQSKNSNLSEVERAMRLYESVSKGAV